MKEVRRGSGGEQGGGDLAGDEAAFADAGEDDAVAGLGGGGEEGGNALEGVALGAFEALGEVFESGGFDADELGWGAVGGGLWRVGHSAIDRRMLADGRESGLDLKMSGRLLDPL
jgi:hypothetical protein